MQRTTLLAGLACAAAAPSMAQGGTVRWRVEMPGYATTNHVAIAPDGTIYANNDDRLMAFDPDGTLQWEIPNTSQRFARPISVAADGTIYAGGLGFGQVNSLNPDGSLRWAYTPATGYALMAGPSLAPDGNIYAIADDLGIYSLDSAGNLRWVGQHELTTSYNNWPLRFDSERVFAGIDIFGGGPTLHVYRMSDGAEIWSSFSTGVPWNGHPVLDPSGRVIGPRWPTYAQALRPEDGSAVWYSEHPGPTTNFLINQPKVGSDGAIYTSDISGGDLWALESDGSTRWFLSHTSGTSVAQLGVSPDAEVIVAHGQSGPRWLRGYDTADGTILWEIELEPENGVNQFVSAFDMVFSPDSRTVYVATNFLGTTIDHGFLYAVAITDEVGTPYCAGDGSALPCPCGNSGIDGHGCANGTFAQGCELRATGNPSVASDTVVLEALTSTPGQPGLFFQGDNAVNGGNGQPFGDGLRCAGTNVVRLQTRFADGSGTAVSSVPISTAGGVAPGDTRRYQWWYRDPVLSPCGALFNLSNGVEIDWMP